VALVRKIVALAAVIALGAVLGVLTISSDGRGPARPAAEAAKKKPKRPNVVMLILDEFPGDALLGRGGRIDAERYPNFAALAGDGYWFRNTYSAYDSTPKAVPLLMDGMRPYQGQPASPAGHPRTLFDLFGRRGYRLRVSEEATRICPPRWCGRRPKPSVLANLGAGRPQRLKAFFRTIKPGRRPGFWLKHALLPHNPYRYLPDGSQTTAGASDPIKGLNRPAGFHDEFLTRHNEQRFLLQLGFTDHLLGMLLRRLRRNGMYDRTMIVVVADHGFAWQAGVDNRRRVLQGNVAEIGPVPFIVKAPVQSRGRVVDSYVSTVDVAPTIADLAGMRLPYNADGSSAFSRKVRKRRALRIPGRDFDFVVRISGREWERRRRKVVARRLRMFGSGDTGFYDGIGPNQALVGRSLDELRPVAAASVRGSLTNPGAWRNVRRSAGVVPVEVTGSFRGGRRGATRAIAVAVNGRVEAVGRTFYLDGDRVEHFAAMVPPSSLREGANDVRVFEVGRGLRLRLAARD
jgi:Sulfatase